MSFYQLARMGNVKKFHQSLKQIAEKENRSYLVLGCTFALDLLRFRCGFADFLNYRFYDLSAKEKKEYVSAGVQDWFYETFNPAEYKEFFTVKPNFLRNFSAYISRDFFVPGGQEDDLAALTEFLKKHTTFIVKPLNGLAGQDVHKESADRLSSPEEWLSYLKDENFFAEELICQHPAVAAFNPASVNTIRIMTFCEGGESRVLYAGMRIGCGDAGVDNFHQGGMGVLVDLESGRLVGNAVNKNLEWFTHHPVSKIAFDGFQIPHWQKILDTVLEAAKVNPHIHLVGWDVAVTPEGCTFVEGNRRAGFDLVQMTSRRGRKDIFRSCLEEINRKRGTNYRL